MSDAKCRQLPGFRLVSPDDHVQAPPHLWQERLSSRHRGAGPQIRRLRGVALRGGGKQGFEEQTDGRPADVWEYDGQRFPILLIAASAGVPRSEVEARPMTFDEMRPGYFQPEARLEDMDTAGIEASVCYPNMFIRFCGQTFSLAKDKELALACVRAYNDFIDQEWAAGSQGRLVRMGIVPLWDVGLAAAEVRRLADLGFRSITFSEAPHLLGFPSLFSGYWNPLFAACEETDTVISLHIGTGGFPTFATDGPSAPQNVLTSMNSAYAMMDWIFSGLLEKFPKLKLCLAESQLGWIPYVLERADFVWGELKGEGFTGVDHEAVPHPPSYYFSRNVWCTFFRDPVGLHLLDRIGVERVLFETDYPHTDTMWPDCLPEAIRMTEHLSVEATKKILGENARALFRIDVEGLDTGRIESSLAASDI